MQSITNKKRISKAEDCRTYADILELARLNPSKLEVCRARYNLGFLSFREYITLRNEALEGLKVNVEQIFKGRFLQ